MKYTSASTYIFVILLYNGFKDSINKQGINGKVLTVFECLKLDAYFFY